MTSIQNEHGGSNLGDVNDYRQTNMITRGTTRVYLIDSPPCSPVRRPASRLDPYNEIQAFLRLQESDGVCGLRHWRGSWHQYGSGYYAELTDDDVQCMLVRHLSESASHLTTSIIANHKMQLKAQAGLASSINPPAWLGAPPRPWPAEEVLACRNQLIHLPSLAINADYACPATPRFFTPVALDYDFDIHAPRPENWLAFLNQLWPDDPQSTATLQEWFGYCLTLDTRQQKMLMIVGPRRSGKGTIARVLSRLVGDRNVAGPTLSSLSDRFGLWPLPGKSVAIFPDARLGRRTESSVAIQRLLSISAEEPLAIDRKHMPVVESKLHTRLMFLSNDLPQFSTVSAALADRVVTLRLSRSWFGREDPGLFNRLAAEIPGILRWAIEGWQRLFASPRLCLRSRLSGIEQR